MTHKKDMDDTRRPAEPEIYKSSLVFDSPLSIPVTDSYGRPAGEIVYGTAPVCWTQPVQAPVPIKAYVAGPMRGYPEYNFPAFDAAAKLGRSLGFEVISPAEEDRKRDKFNEKTGEGLQGQAVYVKRDVDFLISLGPTGAIALLPGWEKSTGARAEKAVAEWLSLKVLDARTFQPFEASPRKERSILTEAQGLVHGDRNVSYGAPVDDFTRTAGMWTSLFAKYLKIGAKFLQQDVAKAMICVKLSRTMAGSKRDSWTDIAGYAETGDWTEEDLKK
jgi:hypothetical protein